MLARLWIAFKGWGWIGRVALIVIAPWLVVAAWAVATGKPRWVAIGAPVLVGALWVAAAASPSADDRGGEVTAAGRSSIEASTTSTSSSTTTLPLPPTTRGPVTTVTTARPATTRPVPVTSAPLPSPACHPSYEGACVPADASDVDCVGGSGNGPAYTGRVTVVGPDVYDLDRDGDGVGCE
ncbi:MAG TPA: hypothetical protein VI916_07475 [Acidimicrobiia bacterium]|nr:hypothetical protein [Acidimicrobiia bacterium]